MEEPIDFDSRKFLDSFKLTPEQDDSFMANYLGEDYVSFQENRTEKARVYQEAEQERFASKLDTEFKDDPENKYYKRATLNPEFIKMPIHDKETLDLTRRSVKKKSDWNTVTKKSFNSLRQQLIINNLLIDPDNRELQENLASLVRETRKISKEISPELERYQYDLGEGIRGADLLGLTETVLLSPYQTSKQLYEMGVTFSPNIAGAIAGRILAGPFGSILLSAATTYAQESLLWAEDWFNINGHDLGDPAHVARVFNDEKLREELKLSMKKRATTMAGLQAAFTATLSLIVPGGASAISRMAKLGLKGKRAVGKGLSISGEMVSEGVTEYAGRGAALGFENLTDEDRGEAYIEGLFSLLPGAARAVMAEVKGKIPKKKTEEKAKVEEKVDPEAPPPTEAEVKQKAVVLAEKLQRNFQEEARKNLEKSFSKETIDEVLGESEPLTDQERASIPDEINELKELEKKLGKKDEKKRSGKGLVSFEVKQKEPPDADADREVIRKSLNTEKMSSLKSLINIVPSLKKLSEAVGEEQAIVETIYYQTVVPIKMLEQEVKRSERSKSEGTPGLQKKLSDIKAVYKKITGENYKPGEGLKTADTKTAKAWKILKWKSIAESYNNSLEEKGTDIGVFKKTLLSIISSIGKKKVEINQETREKLSPKELAFIENNQSFIENIQSREDLSSVMDSIIKQFSNEEIKSIIEHTGMSKEQVDVIFPEIFSEKGGELVARDNTLEKSYDDRIKYALQKLKEFKRARQWKKWKIDIEPYITGTKKWAHAIQLPEHLFQRIDSHEPDGLFSTIFRSVRENYWKSHEKLEEIVKELQSKIPKDLFTPENNLKEFKIKGLPSFKFKGINDLMWFILNTGNSSNINGILDFDIHDPNIEVPKTTLRKILSTFFMQELEARKIGRKEGFQRAAGEKSADKRGVSYQLSQLVGDFNIGKHTNVEAAEIILKIMGRMRKNSGNNIYNHPDIKQLIATIIHLEKVNSVKWNAEVNIEDFNSLAYAEDDFHQKVIEPLMVGWLINNIEGIPTSAFRFAETIWNLFSNLNDAENNVLEGYGEKHGTINADIPLDLAPWVFLGGYFPLRSEVADQIFGGGSVEGFSKGPHTRKRTDKPGVYPTNIDLDTILFSSIRSRIRNIYEFGSFFYAVTTIGPRNQALNDFMTAHLPDVAPVINNWLDRVNKGAIYPIKKNDYITRFVKQLANRGKTVVLAIYPKTAIEQQTGVFFKGDITLGELKESYGRVVTDIRNITRIMHEKSVVMRNYNREQMFELFDTSSKRIIPVQATTKSGLATKRAIELVKKGDEIVTAVSYLGIVLSQSVVNKALWWAQYNKVLNEGVKYDGKIWPPGNEKLAIQLADSLVIKTQGSFSAVDASTLQAHPFAQLLKPFMSFHTARLNDSVTQTDKVLKDRNLQPSEKTKRILYYLVATSVIAATPSFLWFEYYREKDEDEEKRQWLYNYMYYVAEYYVSVMDMGTPLAPVSPVSSPTRFLLHPQYSYRDFMAEQNVLGLDFVQAGLYSAQGAANLLEGEKLSPQKKDIGNIPDLKDWQKKKIAFGVGYVFPPAYNLFKLYKRVTKEPKKKKGKQKWK